MKMVKIYADRVTIKFNNHELDHITINTLMLLDDGVNNVIAIVTNLTDNEMTSVSFDDDYIGEAVSSFKTIECNIIGCLKDGKFLSSVNKYPSSKVSITEITELMFENMLSSYRKGFAIGEYSNFKIPAYVNGNKFFQRHACIVGNTGSGKSETLAKILQETSQLQGAKMIVFDIHGEYKNLSFVQNLEIGTIVDFPIWFLSYNDFISNILKIKEETSTAIPTALRSCYNKVCGKTGNMMKPNFYDYDFIVQELEKLDNEYVVTGYTKDDIPKTAKGEYNGKLTKTINSMKLKKEDPRFSFMFIDRTQDYFNELIDLVLNNDKPITNIDLSNIPHEMIIPIITTLTKIIYDMHLKQTQVSPLTIVCDEAHVYMPTDFNLSASERRAVEIFEIIAKEGRKFGITLVVATQRPSELNKIIIAQCANFIVGKLNNENDKSMLKGMLPNGISGIIESITMFNPGDVVILGDCVPIPLKIHVSLAKERPISRTIDFWDLWDEQSKTIHQIKL